MTRTILITGAAGGIGRALCRAFTAKGDRVIALDREDALGTFDQSDNLYPLPYDLKCLADTEEALDDLKVAVAALAPAGVDILVNNAAVQKLAPALHLALEDWINTLNVNLTAPFRLVQGLADTLKVVINITSVHARQTKKSFAAYAASKAGLEGLTRALALDLGPRVRVVGLAPAAVSTPMLEAGFEGQADARAALDMAHPLERVADPDEIARAVLFLAGEGASFMTGQTLAFDGGVLARLYDPA